MTYGIPVRFQPRVKTDNAYPIEKENQQQTYSDELSIACRNYKPVPSEGTDWEVSAAWEAIRDSWMDGGKIS